MHFSLPPGAQLNGLEAANKAAGQWPAKLKAADKEIEALRAQVAELQNQVRQGGGGRECACVLKRGARRSPSCRARCCSREWVIALGNRW